MVEGIADDGIVLRQQGFEHTAVGIEASGIEDGVFRVEIFADGSLQLLVEVLASADEAHARHAVATAIHGILGSLYEARIVRKAQIVVGAEVQHCLSAHLNGSLLRAFNQTLVLVKASFADSSQLVLKMLLKFSVHSMRIVGYDER